MTPTCTIPNCPRAHYARGLCQAHYRRHQRGQLGAELALPVGDGRQGQRFRKSCDVAGCDRPHHAGGLCGAHYARQQKGLELEGPIQGRFGRPA